ncbi:MAG: flagellar protein FlgN [Undibacterium sp.]|nr:flagellar protein FlgN [Opitutaceae bacterium]
MKSPWEFIAESLRAELADYGGLLHLFEQQQRSLFARDADSVLSISLAIETQARALSTCRSRREEIVASFAVRNDRPAGSTLRSLLPFIDIDARPLIEALIDEVNHLVHRVRRTSSHNHTLLARVVEVHQETLAHLRPHAFTKTYYPGGRVSVATSQTSSTLRVAG